MTVGALEGMRAGTQSQQQQQQQQHHQALPPASGPPPQSQHQPLPLLPPLPPPQSLMSSSQSAHYFSEYSLHSTPSRLPAPSCSLCAGCGDAITDPYILRVQPDLEWHARCLKCAECGVELNEARTCYVRDGKTYCKADYCRLFANRCAKCDVAFSKTDYVMRARSKVYHIDCFRCYTCSRPLMPGEEFAVHNDSLLCRADFDAIDLLSRSPSACGQQLAAADAELQGNSTAHNNNNNNNNNNSSKVMNNNNNNNSGSRDSIHDQDIDSRDDEDSLSPSGNSETQSNCDRSSISGGGGLVKQSGGGSGGGGGSSKRSKNSGKDSKTTRVRTVLNEKQLHTLRTCYAANPRPDALMKEQLVEMTGLSPRVIRVWFQNKRCKDKKKQILIKQMEHQQQKRTLSGVPMIATSPLPQLGTSCSGAPGISSSCGGQAIDVQSYVSPWALHQLPDHVTPMPGSSSDQQQQQPHPPPPPPPPPPFQQLVNAYQSLYPSDEEDDTCVSLPDTSSCLYESSITRQPI